MGNATDKFRAAIPPRLSEVIVGGRFSSENIVAVMRRMLTGEGDLTGEQELILSYVSSSDEFTSDVGPKNSDEKRHDSRRESWRKAKQRQRQREKSRTTELAQTSTDGHVSLEGISEAPVSHGVVLDERTSDAEKNSSGKAADEEQGGFASIEEQDRRRRAQWPTLDMILEAARTSNCGITEEFARQFYEEMQDRGFAYISHGKTIVLNRYTFRTALKSWWDRRNGKPGQTQNGGGQSGRFTQNIPVCY